MPGAARPALRWARDGRAPGRIDHAVDSTLNVGGTVNRGVAVVAGLDGVTVAGRAGRHWGDNIQCCLSLSH